MIPRVRPSSIKIKPEVVQQRHLGPIRSRELKARIAVTAELQRVRGKGA